MAELIICEKQELTNIADAIRTNTGATETMSIEEMNASLNSHNNELSEIAAAQQDTLITNIITALEGKSAGGGGSSIVETVTGTINFYLPYYPYVFCYEDNNGIINVFETNDSDFHSFNIRKNSLISLHCPTFASDNDVLTAGLAVDVLESVDGLEIISIVKLKSNNMVFSVAICKVTDDFNIDWTEEDVL